MRSAVSNFIAEDRPLTFRTLLVKLFEMDAPRTSLHDVTVEIQFFEYPFIGCGNKKKLNSVAFSPQANYTDRATAAYRRS
jgi:hypothetical protein